MTGTLTEPVGPFAAGTPTLALLADAHEWINSAYGAITDFRSNPGASSAESARNSIAQARVNISYLATRDGSDDASHAARLLLPRIDRATALLNKLGTSADEPHLSPLLMQFDAALDDIEQTLVGAGWD